jgi:hypothetical protein
LFTLWGLPRRILDRELNVFNFCRILDRTTGDALADFDDSLVGRILQGVMCFAIVLTFPLFAFEAAHNMEALLFGAPPPLAATGSTGSHGGPWRLSTISSLSHVSTRSFYNEVDELGLPAAGLTSPRLVTPRESDVEEGCGAAVGLDRVRLLGLGFTLVTGVCTCLVADTSAVIGLVGAGCGIPISYVLPPGIYLMSQLEDPRPGLYIYTHVWREGLAACIYTYVVMCVRIDLNSSPHPQA